ncbi:stage III sporulation protein AB [Caproiciproducens faecalis]|nr:stage III sporulation protein AB [Caproiciproducens faecalis]
MESHRLAMRVEQLERFLRFVSCAQTEIRFSALPVEQIVQRHGGDLEFLRKCGESFQKCGDFQSAWRSGVGSCARSSGFNERDTKLLEGFGSGFGVSDIDGQLSHCALYYELTTQNLKEARGEKERKSRLYQMFGVFSGMAAALLLC